MPVNNKKQVKHQSSPNSAISSGFVPSFWGVQKHNVENVLALKLEMKQFPEDVKYRKQLMLNAGKNPEEYYKLRSVIGLGEIKSIMKDFNENESAYSVGVDDENIKNHTIRANLHIHTLASDGYLSTQELLDKAAAYADEAAKIPSQAKEPFTIAITDHDTTEGAKEAIEIISNNPQKYKNLRVILGTEFTTYNNIATNIVDAATNTHVLAYGIDPNEKTYNKFISDTKHKKQQLAQMMIDKANKIYQDAFKTEDDFFLLPQARSMYNPLNKNIIGIYNYVEYYVKTKMVIDEVILKTPALVEKLEQKNMPLNVDEFMADMIDFYYDMDKNNKPRVAIDSIPMFLAAKLDMSESDVKEIIQNAPKSEEFREFQKNVKEDLAEYKRTLTPKYDYMPTISDVYDALSEQKNTMLGLAHPLDPASQVEGAEKQYEFLTDYYNQFKAQAKEKAGFSEAYYQSYVGDMKEFQDKEETNTMVNELSQRLGLFKTGSADSHRTNIFKRLY